MLDTTIHFEMGPDPEMGVGSRVRLTGGITGVIVQRGPFGLLWLVKSIKGTKAVFAEYRPAELTLS